MRYLPKNKMTFIRLSFVLLVLVLSGCASTQKVTLDPVSIAANAPGANIYRGSYTKTTDILHTKLDLKFNWDSAFVIGKAQIEARPYFYPSQTVALNATGFKINRVSLIEKDEEIPLKYTYDGKIITITLDTVYERNRKFTLSVDYVAMPYKLKVGKDILSEDARGIYFINRDGREKDKPRQIWTQGETEYNSSWFPTINGPQEKMTQEISLTVPDSLVTLSNGSLDFSTENGDGTRTDTWRQEQPHSTYLTMIAVGNFSIVKDKWRDKEVSYYMEPEYAPNAKMIFGNTPEMMEFFSKKLGIAYPWDKYSQIVVRDFSGGAMENTSASVFFEGMNLTEGRFQDENHEDIISHELFHHWFGNLVTCESWANLPLNESFATYGEYLWNEYKYGRDYADFKGMQDEAAYLSNRNFKNLHVIRFNYADSEQMFDNVSYQKGGRILHMLRKIVGDDAFFKALRLYLTKNAYKTVEIHDLRLAFEEITGQDLNFFFNQWFLNSGHPVLKIQTGYDADAKKVFVTVDQTQDPANSPIYTLPVAVDIYAEGKVERKNIVIDKPSQTFSFYSGYAPQLINFDAEKYLLAEKSESKSLAEYVFQYRHAPLFLDRYEAVTRLNDFKAEKSAREVLIEALDDKNWYIRQIAVGSVSYLDAEEKNSVYGRIKKMALSDPRSYVRASAITVLKSVYSQNDNKEVFSEAAKDKAPSVQSALSGSVQASLIIAP